MLGGWNAKSSNSCVCCRAETRVSDSTDCGGHCAELDVTCAPGTSCGPRIATRGLGFFQIPGEIRIVRRAPSRHRKAHKKKDAARFHSQRSVFRRGKSQFIAVITGPNMGGKSTYYLAARRLRLLNSFCSPKSDRLCRRDSPCCPSSIECSLEFGAADNLGRGAGVRTFMVEMDRDGPLF